MPKQQSQNVRNATTNMGAHVVRITSFAMDISHLDQNDKEEDHDDHDDGHDDDVLIITIRFVVTVSVRIANPSTSKSFSCFYQQQKRGSFTFNPRFSYRKSMSPKTETPKSRSPSCRVFRAMSLLSHLPQQKNSLDSVREQLCLGLRFRVWRLRGV